MKISSLFKRLMRLPCWLIFAALSSCYPDSAENFGEEEVMIENAALGAEEAEDALEMSYIAQAIEKTATGGRTGVAACGEISHDPVNKILTIDFGNVNCLGQFGRNRRGKILINYTSQLADTLSNQTVTFSDYYVDDRKVTGTVSLHDISINADSIQSATQTLTDLKVEFVNGTAITFNGNQARTWVSGFADKILYNNVYSLTGSLSGFSAAGRTFTLDITSPVIDNFYCAYQSKFARSQGVVELSHLQGYPDRQRTVNYGTGVCDNVISVITFRRTYGISNK